MTASPSPWAGTRALFPTVPEQSATTVRRAGAFLRTRCGTLEEAFRALDPASTGSLTLESFARGMEKLGYESSLAETTQVFQAMDTGFRGCVGMASFLMAFNDNADDSRLSLQSARAVAASITGADSVAGRSGSSCPSIMDSTDRELDMGSQARRLVEDQQARRLEEMLEEKIACSAVRLELGLQADMAHLREQIAECERSAKNESARLVERIEAKCMDACSAAVEELNGKIESLRQKLREAEIAAAQQQLDVNAVGTKIDSGTSETKGQLKMLQREFQEKLELMQSSMDGTLQACRAEMREWLDEERTATNDRTQALGRALTEEFQHSIVAQATASARTEACAVTCQVVSKEFETWQKDGSAVQSDLVQVGERLSKLEKKLMSLDLAEGNGLTAALALAADVHGTDKLEESAEKRVDDGQTPLRLESMLLSILEKLDNKCLDSFATDIKELSTLLEDSRLKGGNFRDLNQKLHEIDSTAYAASTTSEASVAEVSSASKVQDTIDRPSAETSKGMSIQKLREDIFGYLRSEFQDVVSQTIAGINIKERSASPIKGSACLPMGSVRDKASEIRSREFSRPKPQDSNRARLQSSPLNSPAVAFRNLDQRIGTAPESAKRRESTGSVGPLGGSTRAPLRVHCADMRGSRSPGSPPPPSSNKSPTISTRPTLPSDRGPFSGNHQPPLTPTTAGRLIPSSFAGSLSVEAPRGSVEVPRMECGADDRASKLPVGQTPPGAHDSNRGSPFLANRNAYDSSHTSSRSSGAYQANGRVQSVPAPEEIRSSAVQAMHQRGTLSGNHPGRALSETASRGISQHLIPRNRAGATESTPK